MNFPEMCRNWIWAAGLITFTVSGAAQEGPGVQLAVVEQSDIVEEVTLNGTASALRSSRLSASVEGLVDLVNAQPGDRVAKGDLLIELDDELAGLALASARAESQEAEARLAEARRRLDEARSVGAGRNIAATEVSARESEVATTEATLLRLQATQQRQAALVKRHSIAAPYEGVIQARHTDLGEWVTPGDPLVELVDISNLRLDFQVPQNMYNLIDGSTELQVSVEGTNNSERLTVDIDVLVPVSDSGARTFLLRASAPEELRVLPGMALTGLLRTDAGRDGLSVPRDAINRYPDGRVTVWIAEPAGNGQYRVEEKRIELGTSYRDRMVVTDGLEAGLRVVSRGNEALRQGMTVRVVGEGAR
ncbi:efflux RND transporter periplasmic adaptor subunit [Marinobacter changyiensis]|uniref:efflux RND transporter periplasmic adaptor subunit n=1 Tax=Marinobacter changyiensis TaxID=2604091 RepID=UPI001FE8A2E8|nr:efflux RND transporter periplasmic adaptor subunit [Marinobacter changyiensis]